jgi:hypothetical protein
MDTLIAPELREGTLRRQVLRGTEAVYRVVGMRGELTDVEVVRAPGLQAGGRFAFMTEAVAAMEPVSGLRVAA